VLTKEYQILTPLWEVKGLTNAFRLSLCSAKFFSKTRKIKSQSGLPIFFWFEPFDCQDLQKIYFGYFKNYPFFRQTEKLP